MDERNNENFAESVVKHLSGATASDYYSLLPAHATKVGQADKLIGQHNTKFVVELNLLPNSAALEAKFLTATGVDGRD